MGNPTKFSWTAPTTNTDGSAVAAGEITGYNIGIRLTTAAGSVAGTYPIQVPVAGAGTLTELLSQISPPLGQGSYAAAVMDTGAVNSAWSTEVTFSISPTPNPPGNFTVS